MELERESKDSKYRFEAKFRDLHALREWYITQPPVDYEDVGFVTDMLARLSPEMRQYVIGLSTLILKAAE